MSANILSPGRQPLSDAEIDRLSGFLSSLKNPNALTFEGMDGFFCALIAGPDTVMPSEYLPVLWGGELADENAFASLEEVNATLQLVMRHWNSIITELESDGVYGPAIDDPDEHRVPGRRWARGFMRGVALEVRLDRAIHRRQRRATARDSARRRRDRPPMAGRAALR
jgi:uncharacterized protein